MDKPIGVSVLPSLPCWLPQSRVSNDINADEVATRFESRLVGLTVSDWSSDSLWRDVFAFTGTLRTFYGAAKVSALWLRFTHARNIEDVKLEANTARVIRLGDDSSWVQARYNCEISGRPRSTCKIILSLVPGDGDGGWQIWVMRTVLDRVDGYPDVDTLLPAPAPLQTNGDTSEPDVLQSNHRHFDCVVVGGGQAGLSVGGRLKALGLSYVVLDKNEQLGDNWRLRYDSTRLHTTRDSSHLPFDRTFPAKEYGKFLTKDELARGNSTWAQKFGITVWLRSSLKAGRWLDNSQTWQLEIDRAGRAETLSASHIVMASGAGGQIPRLPTYPGRENFQGLVQHSSEYRSAMAWKGKAGIVIGTANTGHDVAEDMVHAGCSSVTMVQRSPTYVFATEYYEKVQDAIYNDQIPTGVADMSHLANPIAVTRLLSNYNLHARTKADPERYDGLERAGFRLVRYGDITHQLYECFGGHYMDVGAVDKINRGLIKIKSDAFPVKYTRRGLIFSDGKELDADVVVLATGFQGNTKSLVREIFGDQVADRIEDFWGLDAEGEIRGAFRPLSHPNIWMIGGSIGQARYFSRFIALSIRMAIDGIPMTVYRD